MTKTLLCTVGTSLMTNLIHDSGDLKSLYEQAGDRRLPALIKKLISIPPAERLLGAEINSIASLIKKIYIADLRAIVLLVSDTPDAAKISRILKSYLETNPSGLLDKKTEIEICASGQDDEDIYANKFEGVRGPSSLKASYV